MRHEYQHILNGPAMAMIEFIKSHNINIDIRRLENMDTNIRVKKLPVTPDFLIESRNVREYLKKWFEETE
ncbi:hypothetical protein M3P05_10565 [Sansalvadorimonas sp. 2012CJ34-2]|uniref:Uncharacterized protein n=1 Tax=Parendozoicomonas callyspongiae TaxID=2942213 RepID=A0ABT0PG67_9GAMM|nr:hypothetical protein [Sansalvadorimonas sp. 2012CJ34-2]MCL6270362.1 hypothetical protein [Sansalvadorimonas sp. 2012CJ34-2]